MTLALDPCLPVLLRPDGCVQLGWSPRRAVLLRPPDGLSVSALLSVLRSLPMETSAAIELALRLGLQDSAALESMLVELSRLGVLQENSSESQRALSIRVHGDGPLSVLLADGLRCSGARVSVTSHGNAAVSGADLVVLADALATDPRLLRELHTARTPHLPVRVRDGTGFVGPLVIPGVTSCLSCVDRHRTDRDAAWPALSAQLREVIGCADRPTVLATAALALSQLQRVIAGVRGVAGAAPSALNTSWEIDVADDSLTARRWPRHPLCGCWDGRG